MVKVLQFFAKESELIAALQQGNAKAQQHLYEKYAGKMMALCLRYINDTMAAEDVMIEGFMKIFQKINQYRYEGSFEGWLKKLMTNEALMYLRTQRYQEIATDQVLSSEISIESDIDESLTAEVLLDIIQQLPTGYRTVFNLYAIEGYSHAEIAEMLHITESTSKSQLHRARAMLQQIIQVKSI